MNYASLLNDDLWCEIIGGYPTLEEAQTAMKNEVENKMSEMKELYSFVDNDIVKNEDKFFEFDNVSYHFQNKIQEVLN